MTDHDPASDASTLARRNLIRGGAVLAGAAGLTAVGAALAPKASATDGSPIVQGADNVSGTASTATTTLRINSPGSTVAPLTLRHANLDSPQLTLSPRPTYAPDAVLPTLRPGEIVNTNLGPYIGLSDGQTPATEFIGLLATNIELDDKPEPQAIRPVRVLDTRTAAGRTSIKGRSSAAAQDSSFRLVRGGWIDVAVATDNDDSVVDGAYIGLTAVGATAAGALEIYPPGLRSATPSVYVTNASPVCNSSFVQVLLSGTNYLVRIFTTATTHVLLDVTGYAVRGPSAEPATTTSNARRRGSAVTARAIKGRRKR